MPPEQEFSETRPEPHHWSRIILIIIGVLILSGGVYLYYLYGNTQPAPELTQEQNIDTSDWQTYRNEEYGFEFRYPKEWLLQTSNNPGSKVILSVNYKTFNNKDAFFHIFDFGGGIGTQTIEKWKLSQSYSNYYFREIIISDQNILEQYESACIAEHGQCSENSIVITFHSDLFFQKKIDVSLFIDDEEEINNSDIYNKYKQEVEVIEKLLSTFKFID